MSSTDEINAVRRAKEDAVETGDWAELARLRDLEKELLSTQAKEFKPNGRGS